MTGGARACGSAALVAAAMALAIGPVPSADEARKAEAAKPVSFGVNAFFPPDLADVAWQRRATDRVVGAWKPSGPSPRAGKKAVVMATIARDGKLLDAYFNLRSGRSPFDEAALRAVRKASPFPALPRGYPRDVLECHWHFEAR